jgi:hypothetical protein
MQWKLSTSRQSVQSELSAMPRGDLTKNQWNYIKKNKLQEGREKEDSDQRRRRAESCLWWQEAGQHVRDDQTRLWACKIGAIPSGDCLGRQKLNFRVDLHGNLLVSNLVNLLNRSFNLKEGFSQRRTEAYKF